MSHSQFSCNGSSRGAEELAAEGASVVEGGGVAGQKVGSGKKKNRSRSASASSVSSVSSGSYTGNDQSEHCITRHFTVLANQNTA